MESIKPSQEAITFIVLLSAMQVVLNCSTELKGTQFDTGKVKEKVRESVNIMTLFFNKNHQKIWQIDDLIAAKIMQGIQIIGEQVAKGDGTSLATITDLTRNGIDFSKYSLIELKDDNR